MMVSQILHLFVLPQFQLEAREINGNVPCHQGNTTVVIRGRTARFSP